MAYMVSASEDSQHGYGKQAGSEIMQMLLKGTKQVDDNFEQNSYREEPEIEQGPHEVQRACAQDQRCVNEERSMTNTWLIPMATLDMVQMSGFDFGSATFINMMPIQQYPCAYSEPSAKWANVTTVMLRNIPNKYSQCALCEELNNEGYAGLYDFIYLPIDMETLANKGYAFINFVDPRSAWAFKCQFDDCKMSRFNSSKVICVVPAALQGLEANHAHYSFARVSRGDPKARPLFLAQPGGLGRDFCSSQRGGRPRLKIQSADMEAKPDSAEAECRRFCPFCGERVNSDFKFCVSCGTSMEIRNGSGTWKSILCEN